MLRVAAVSIEKTVIFKEHFNERVFLKISLNCQQLSGSSGKTYSYKLVAKCYFVGELHI